LGIKAVIQGLQAWYPAVPPDCTVSDEQAIGEDIYEGQGD